MSILVAMLLAAGMPCTDEKIRCLGRALGAASAEKDNLSAKVVTAMRMKGENPQAFLDAQESFANFRDKECQAVSGSNAGYLSDEAGLECWIRLTEERSLSIWRVWLKRADVYPQPDN